MSSSILDNNSTTDSIQEELSELHTVNESMINSPILAKRHQIKTIKTSYALEIRREIKKKL